MSASELVVLFKDSREAVLLARGLHRLGWAPRAVRSAGLVQQSLARRPAAVLLIEDRAVGMNAAAWLDGLGAVGLGELPAVIVSNLPAASSSPGSLGVERHGAQVLAKPFTLAAVHSALLRATGQSAGQAEESDPPTPHELLLIRLGEAARSPRPVTVVRETSDGTVRFHVRAGRLLGTSATPPTLSAIGPLLQKASRLRAGDLAWAEKEIGPRGRDADLLDILRKYCGLADGHAAEAVRRQCMERLRFALHAEGGDVRSVATPTTPPGLCLLDEPLDRVLLQCLRARATETSSELVLERGRRSYQIGRGVLGALRRLTAGPGELRFVDALAAGRSVVGAMDVAEIGPAEAGPLLMYLERVAGAPVSRKQDDPAAQARSFARRRLQQTRTRTPPTPPTQASPAQAPADAAIGAPRREELLSRAARRISAGRYDEAAASLDELLAADPDDAEALAHLGYCRFHLRSGSRLAAAKQARELLQRSRELDPESPLPLLHLARIARKLGEADDAMIHAAQALNLAPADGAAERELARAQELIAERGATTIPTAQAQAPPTPAAAGSVSATADLESSLIEALRSLGAPAAAVEERAEFAVAVATWTRGGSTSSTFGGSHVPLEVKTALMRAVRESGATLREFSRARLCAVLRSDGAKEELRLGAATLGNRLLTELRGLQSTGRAEFAACFALELSDGPVAALDAAVADSIRRASSILETADPWQVLAPRPMFDGFEGLVDIVDVPGRPGIVYVLGGQGATSIPSLAIASGPPATPPAAIPTPPPTRPSPAVGAEVQRLATPRSVSISGGLGRDSIGMSGSIGGVSMALSPGITLGDAYRIEAFIGAGGMGEVYRAIDIALDRPVALKVVRRELLANPLSLRRFRREAQALATLNSPNVTQIFSLSLTSDPAYLVMELVEGPSLRDLLQERCSLTVGESVELALQVVEGLETVYQQGLIHRDINPKNLLLDRTGLMKITDFGLVKAELVGASLSGSQAVVGTPLYISPEQAQGGVVDFRTDLYSFGITLYHMLAGRPPFGGSTVAELLTKHILEPLPALRRACPLGPPRAVRSRRRSLRQAPRAAPQRPPGGARSPARHRGRHCLTRTARYSVRNAERLHRAPAKPGAQHLGGVPRAVRARGARRGRQRVQPHGLRRLRGLAQAVLHHPQALGQRRGCLRGERSRGGHGGPGSEGDPAHLHRPGAADARGDPGPHPVPRRPRSTHADDV